MSNDKLSEIDEMMLGELELPLPRMKESTFKAEFLPMLNLDGIPKEHEDLLLERLNQGRNPRRLFKPDMLPSIMYDRWISYVGQPTLECEIVDDNTGEILFVVPSAYTDIPPLTNTKNLDRILETASRKANVLPEMGDRIIENAIAPLINRAEVDPVRLAKWNVIFERYNMPRYKLPGEVTQETAKQNEVDPGDDFDQFF